MSIAACGKIKIEFSLCPEFRGLEHLHRYILSMNYVLVFSTSIFFVCCSSYQSPCNRFATGSYVQEPKQFSSALGLLDIRLLYKSGTNIDGSVYFCYLTQDGVQSPTLVVWPGDHLRLTLTNLVEVPPFTAANMATLNENYGTNLHFHGMTVSPAPGQDFALTLVPPGMSTTYELDIPADHPTGLFWSEKFFSNTLLA